MPDPFDQRIDLADVKVPRGTRHVTRSQRSAPKHGADALLDGVARTPRSLRGPGTSKSHEPNTTVRECLAAKHKAVADFKPESKACQSFIRGNCQNAAVPKKALAA